MEYYFECYGDLTLQRMMVADAPRTDAFAAAIAEIIEGGERVLDVGTGTGLLAMLAAKAGAAQVWGVDQADVAGLARELVEHNQLADTVTILDCDAKKVQLDAPVDVLMSEWLGHFAFAEAMLDDVIIARDRNLKPGGTMLPSGIELKLAPCSTPNLYHNYGPGFWAKPIHGLDYSPLEAKEVNQAFARKSDVPASSMLAPGASMYVLDLATATRESPWQSGQLQFVIERDGTLDGFVGWFVAQLSPSVDLDTGPEAPYTHWAQTHLLFPPRPVTEGETLTVDYVLKRHPYQRRSLELQLTVDDQPFHYTID